MHALGSQLGTKVFITTRADLPRAIQLKLSGKHPGDEAHSLKITPNEVSIASSAEDGLFRGSRRSAKC